MDQIHGNMFGQLTSHDQRLTQLEKAVAALQQENAILRASKALLVFFFFPTVIFLEESQSLSRSVLPFS